jgi:hypothetical protein
MKTRVLAWAAALVCCYSCIETDTTLGGSLVPTVETYTFHTVDIPLEGITMQMADNLSGYSDSRMTIGAIREPEYGLTTRASAITLVPLFLGDKLDMGQNPVFRRFRFATACDSVCVFDQTQANILQHVHVYELDRPLDPAVDYDVNRAISHGTESIVKGTPVLNGTDSLTFEFTEEFGKRYMSITQDDLKDMETYLAKFPGIYLETETPDGDGGRINMLEVQMPYDKNNYYVLGNFASLSYSAEFRGVRKDTTVNFWYGVTDFYGLDSLFAAYTGTFPQYALNYTGQQTRGRAGEASDKIWIEGGGGLKPVIPARGLKHQVEQAIIQAGGNPQDAIINKASLIFPFDFPEDYKDMAYFPYRLSPTCRFTLEGDDEDEDDIITYMGLTDASSSSENQGNVDRSLLRYAPDITYHMQEILKIDESATDKTSTKNLLAGNYDIWLLVNAQETQTTVTTASQEQQEMMNYLAYQSYYNGMYGGGYGGYGSGYGSYGSYYNNYLTYAMMAQQMSQSQTSTSISIKLDVDRFYRAALHGPQHDGDVPILRLVFALPNQE